MKKAGEELIHSFYEAFSRKDAIAMAQCYHPSAVFTDPVFELKEKEVPAMWHMLCEKGKDLHIQYSNIEVFGNTASANWVATYTFSSTQRPVQNEIEASFIFKDGLIIRHTDNFDFHRWSTQALGLPGLLFGWSSFFKKKVQKQATEALNVFISTHPEYRSA